MHQVSSPDVPFFCTDTTARKLMSDFLCLHQQTIIVTYSWMVKITIKSFNCLPQLMVIWYSVFLLAPLLADSFQIHDFYLNTITSIKTI